ncbi:MAG: hypothetical protein WBO10_04310 [Pyrinomonadaceae bacterium]
MKFEFHPEARIEFIEAIAYYETSRVGLRILRYTFVQLIALFLLSITSVTAQQTKIVTVTTSEPSTVSLDALFAQADIVAFVSIRSGDAENYDVSVYKAVILKAYKGTKVNEIIYFTPFNSYGLGSEYLVFLKKTGKRIETIVSKESKRKVLPYDAKQPFSRIMYDGYSVMEASFQCAFEEPTHQTCTDAVKFNVKQIVLPIRLKTYPLIDEDVDVLDVRYVKRKEIEPLLDSLSRTK